MCIFFLYKSLCQAQNVVSLRKKQLCKNKVASIVIYENFTLSNPNAFVCLSRYKIFLPLVYYTNQILNTISNCFVPVKNDPIIKNEQVWYFFYSLLHSLGCNLGEWSNLGQLRKKIKHFFMKKKRYYCRYSMSTIWAFDHIEKNHTLYDENDCMKKFCESLGEHKKNRTDFEKKKILPITKEELKSHQDAKVCYSCGNRSLKKIYKCINYQKVRVTVIIQENIKAQHKTCAMCPMKSL